MTHPVVPSRDLWLGGGWRAGRAQRLALVDPATGRAIGSIPAASEADAADAGATFMREPGRQSKLIPTRPTVHCATCTLCGYAGPGWGQMRV